MTLGSKASARDAVKQLLDEVGVKRSTYALSRDTLTIITGGEAQSFALSYPAMERNGEARVLASIRRALLN